jgi:hypothetical protein
MFYRPDPIRNELDHDCFMNFILINMKQVRFAQGDSYSARGACAACAASTPSNSGIGKYSIDDDHSGSFFLA